MMKIDISMECIIVFVMILLILGVVVGVTLPFTGGNAVIQTKVLDQVCKDIYGQHFVRVDSGFGVDIQLDCKYIPSIQEEKKELIVSNGYEKDVFYYINNEQEECIKQIIAFVKNEYNITWTQEYAYGLLKAGAC